ncbi:MULTISPECIES: hypothetical protein [Sphingobium]|uniref:hypothetical protein n=1 Tax=Sphingobium sp. MI1205 TaxID=407020 RepID=UPI00076FF798|nr:hypothetical protein [Sphingobium sp. MI1205]AMK17070.1 hypothetical protein K663_03405 [Sphingobium sp. MI1205]
MVAFGAGSASADHSEIESTGAYRVAQVPNPLRYVRFCLWMGPALLVLLIVFFALLGRNIPPYSAALSADEIAAHFREHTTSARIGMTGMMVSGVLYLVWGMGITKVMEAAERDNDLMSRLQLWGAGFTTLVLVFPPAFWLAAAFRPETDPLILMMLYDTGWIMFDMAFSLTMLQITAFALCFLNDGRVVPLIPKPVCWFAIWVAVAFMGFCFLPFFRDGPFSRSGFFNYWVEFSLFFWAMLILSIFTLRALTRLEQEAGSAFPHG